jgi:hypothetical protein
MTERGGRAGDGTMVMSLVWSSGSDETARA